MNIKDRIIQLNHEHTSRQTDIKDLQLTIVCRYQLFEPCIYLSEDEEWLNVALISIENDELSQAMSILKSEISAFGVFNKENISFEMPQVGSEDLYQ